MWKKQIGLGLLVMGLSGISQADIVYFQDFSSGLNSNENLQVGAYGDDFAYRPGDGNVSTNGYNATGGNPTPYGVGSVYTLNFSSHPREIYSGNATLSFDYTLNLENNFDMFAVVGGKTSASAVDFLPIVSTGNANVTPRSTSTIAVVNGGGDTINAPTISPFDTWGVGGGASDVLNVASNGVNYNGTAMFDLTGLLDAGILDVILQTGLWRDASAQFQGYSIDNVTITVDNVTVIPNPAVLSLFGLGLLGLVTQRRLTRKP